MEKKQMSEPAEEKNIQNPADDCCGKECCCGQEKAAEQKPCKCKKIRRILIWTAGVILALLALLLIFRDIFITAAVTHAGTFIVGTKVELKKFSSSLTGKVDIQGLTVANPEGFHNPYAFSLERVYVDISIPSLFTDEIVVNEILVTGMQVDLEAKLNKTNLGVIQENVARLVPAEDPNDQNSDVNADASENEQQLVIKKLTINNNNVSFSNALLKLTAKVPLVPISMTDVGKGMTIPQTINTVFVKILTSVFDACAGVGGALGDSLKNAGSFFGDSASEISKGIGNTAESISDGTGKFFKKLIK